MAKKNPRKKELLLAYREQKTRGGVYKITNTANGRYLLKAATNVQGDKKRFEFAQKTGSCVSLALQQDWQKYGASAFTFEILEEIEIKDTQTLREFQEDLKVLGELWAEKFEGQQAY